jgi:hypothetical protein
MTDTNPARSRVEEQTRIRRALLKGGYVPLANRDKLCVLPGWPGLKVDAKAIEAWSDMLRYVATGVRVDGPMVVLDFDIDDADMLDLIWDRLPDDLVRLLDSAPLRFGGGAKFAVFLRRAEGDGGAFGRMVSQGYAPPGVESVMRVEVFDAGAPRQFGVYGARSHDASGAVETEYRWAGGWGLADVPLKGLPAITLDQIKAVLDCASVAMREAGWQYEVATHSGVVDGRPRYDVAEDAVFVTADHGDIVGVDALAELCSIEGPGVRLSASWLEGGRAVNTQRCIARLNVGDGRLQIWETASCVLHRPAGMDVRSKIEGLAERLRSRGEASVSGSAGEAQSGGGGASRLEALLAAVPPDQRLFQESAVSAGGQAEEPAVASGADAFDQALATLLDSWAFVAIGGGFAAPLGGTADDMLTFGGLTAAMAPWCKMVPRGKREPIEVSPARTWLGHPQRKMVVGHKLMPWTTDLMAAGTDGREWLNTYRPAAHGGAVSGGPEMARRAVAVWQRFLMHLVPDARERAWFEMWLAAKVAKPWVPNCAVVMVAETHGTGRGTLFDMLAAVVGDRHVRPVSSTELMGGSGQGQYTDWLADAVLVTCDELLAGDDAGGTMTWKRREVYERLKGLVDPRARRVRIVRKGLPSYETDVFASFLMATNNPNALPLAPQDRRFAVIKNTDVKLEAVEDGALLAALAEWRRGEGGFGLDFGGAVWSHLAGVAVDWDQVRDAPTWMLGRAEMLAANEGDLEEIVAGVLADVPGDFILNEHLRSRIRLALEAGGMDHEIKNWWVRAQDMLARRNGTGWRRMAQRQDVQPRSGGGGRKFVTVYMREAGLGEAGWNDVALEDRPALWKRGADLNDRLSRVESKMRERGLKVLE